MISGVSFNNISNEKKHPLNNALHLGWNHASIPRPNPEKNQNHDDRKHHIRRGIRNREIKRQKMDRDKILYLE
jgi:hypothetical protein